MDYSLDEDAEKTGKEKEEAKTKFDEDNMQSAVKSFLRFNGFVEDGTLKKQYW